MTFRIAIAGPAGAGKTTLAQALADELYLRLIPESIRIVAHNMKLKGIRYLTYDTRLMLQSAALSAQIEREDAAGSFVTDRATLDYLFYHEQMELGALEHAHAMAFDRLTVYTHLFIVPSPSQFHDDGFRLRRPDADIIPFLHFLGPSEAQNVHQLQTDGVENRLAECLRIIRGEKCND